MQDSLAEVKAWAKAEGFDLMGSDAKDRDRNSYTIETIDLEAWEITNMEWHPQEELSSQAFIFKGEPTPPPVENTVGNSRPSDRAYYRRVPSPRGK